MLKWIRKIVKSKKKETSDEVKSPLSTIPPIQHIDIFEKILPFVTEKSDVLRLRLVCRTFQECIDSSDTFTHHVKSSWANINEKNIKIFCSRFADLPWVQFRLLDVANDAFYDSAEFRVLLGKLKAESPWIRIKVNGSKRKKKIPSSVKHKIIGICQQEGLTVDWVCVKAQRNEPSPPSRNELHYLFSWLFPS